jgi:ABC-type uncharacterized transport system substrate-binding protein
VKRGAVAFALWLCAIIPAFAQNAENLPIVGILRINTSDTVEPFATGFKDALAAVGLVDGRNIRIEVRLAEGHVERLPELAQSLVRAKASVILAFGPPAIRAAQQATSTIPIVANADLLASGLISSLARPGGNTTGVSMLNTELDAKRLEILKEIVPSGRRFALLGDPATKVPRSCRRSPMWRRRSASSCRPRTCAVPPTWRRLSRRSEPAASRRSTSSPRRCSSVPAKSSAGSV